MVNSEEQDISEIWEDLNEHEDMPIRTALKRALVRCMDSGEVAKQLVSGSCLDYNTRRMLLARLEELAGEDKNSSAARDALKGIIEIDESAFTYPEKQKLDATARRLVRLLPAEEQMALAKVFLFHRRRARRHIGAETAALYPQIVPPDIKQLLLQAYGQWNDPEVLVPLSRLSVDLSDVAPMMLEAFSRLTDLGQSGRVLREQARLFEQLVQSNTMQAVALSHNYPIAFVYGIGRARYQPALPHVLEILASILAERQRLRAERELSQSTSFGEWFRDSFQERHRNEQGLSLSIWALGRLQAREELTELARAYGISLFTTSIDE